MKHDPIEPSTKATINRLDFNFIATRQEICSRSLLAVYAIGGLYCFIGWGFIVHDIGRTILSVAVFAALFCWELQDYKNLQRIKSQCPIRDRNHKFRIKFRPSLLSR